MIPTNDVAMIEPSPQFQPSELIELGDVGSETTNGAQPIVIDAAYVS